MNLSLFFIAISILVLSTSALDKPDANDDQYAFLTELYENTSGEMWTNNTNWLKRDDNTTLCNWYGVTCSGKWVQKLYLDGNGLGGPLPDSWERLPYLESIDLSSNKLLGTLPASIGNLALDTLILSHNSLRGTIPSSIGKSNARLLYLDDNQLSGTLPSSLATNHLQGFTIDLNKLSGTVPSQFGQLGSQLIVINGAFNDFTGTLPVGVCSAVSCNFQYNAHLGCPSQSACGKCYLPQCNCGLVCYSNSDCAGGSCSTCSKGPWGYKTCGGK
eukprot:gene6428-7089_t